MSEPAATEAQPSPDTLNGADVLALARKQFAIRRELSRLGLPPELVGSVRYILPDGSPPWPESTFADLDIAYIGPAVETHNLLSAAAERRANDSGSLGLSNPYELTSDEREVLVRAGGAAIEAALDAVYSAPATE